MKIIIFNDEKEIIEELERLKDPRPFGEDEVKWQGGGAHITENYVIVEDGQKLEDITDEEIEGQRRLQTKITLAREYEEERVLALAEDREEETRAVFEEARDQADRAANKEELFLAKETFNNSAREWARGRGQGNGRENGGVRVEKAPAPSGNQEPTNENE